MFALPYATSALFSNREATVEVCVENLDRFDEKFPNSRAALKRLFNDRALIREADFGRCSPSVLRFIEEPQIKADYTYIGDADILVLEDVLPLHRANMATTGLPYSNIVRPNTRKMTGLHFTRSDAYYPVVIPDVDLHNTNDEDLLYMMVVEKSHILPPEGANFRPLHGYHLSLRRLPTAHLGWGVLGSMTAAFNKLRASDEWLNMLPRFHPFYHVCLLMLSTAVQAVDPVNFVPYTDDLPIRHLKRFGADV